jgi:PhzF family phenazine biosynthesis protein
MKTYTFRKLDAFTTGASQGNPAGCVLLDSPEAITEENMLRIARELGGFVSEVGYIWSTPDQKWAYELRYFSRNREVNFCGHATVAIMHDLLRREPNSKPDMVKIMTPVGLLEVEDRIRDENLVFIHAPEPTFMEVSSTSVDVAMALALSGKALDTSYPIALVNAGLNTLLVAVRTLSDCVECLPDFDTLRAFCLDNGIEIITVYTFDTASRENGIRTRVFAPLFGYLEDPATGSGNAALGYYLTSIGHWNEARVRIEQGTSRENPNIVILKKAGARLQIGGQSVCRIEGSYFLV